MSRAPLTNYSILDAQGDPVPGGLLYTYAGGTTTPLATYSDAAKTVANANPIIADAAGVIGEIYMTDNTSYKFVEKTAADVTLRTRDAFFSVSLTDNSLATRVAQIASSPLDQGAVGDGADDESAEVQAAINAATGTVDLLGKTFKCDSAITLASGIRLVNGTLDFSACTDDSFIIIHGAALGTPSAITSNVDFDDAVVQVTDAVAAGVAADDLINVYDSTTYTGSATRGEVVEISSISTNDVYIQDGASDDYALASAGSARKVNTINDVLLEDLAVLGQESISGTHAVVSIVAGRRVRLNRCRVKGVDSYGVRIAGSYDVALDECVVSDGVTGLQVGDASKYISVDNCRFSGLDTPIIVGHTATLVSGAPAGIPRHVSIRNGSLNGYLSSSPLVTINGDAQFVTLDGVTLRRNMSTANTLVSCACIDAAITNNRIRGISSASESIGINMVPIVPNATSRNYQIRATDNDINVDGRGVVYSAAALAGGSGTVEVVDISRNTVRGTVAGQQSIRVVSGNSNTHPPIEDVILNGNVVDGDIFVQTGHSTPTINRVLAGDNDANDITIDGVSGIRGIASLDLSNTNASLATTVQHVTSCRLHSGRFVGALLIDEVSTVDMVDVTAEGGTIVDSTDYETWLMVNGGRYSAATGKAFEFDASDVTVDGSEFNISGAAFAAVDDNALEVTGVIASGVVNACNLVITTSGNCLELAGDASGNMANILVNGSVLQGGDVGINASNGGNIRSTNNRFVSCTADTVGGIESGSALMEKTIEYSAAEMVAAGTDKQTFVPSEAGKGHVLLCARILYQSGSAAFSVAGGNFLSIFTQDTDTVNGQALWRVALDGFVDQGNDEGRVTSPLHTADVDNSHLVAATEIAWGLSSSLTVGTGSSVRITVYYRVIDL